MNFFVGGYFIVKGFKNDAIGYIPHNYFTVSDCISDIIPNTWAWNKTLSKQDRKEVKINYSLSDEQIESIRKDVLELIEKSRFQLPTNTFSNIGYARTFYSQYFSHLENVKLLGVSLNEKYINEFLDEEGKDDFGISSNLSSYKCIETDGRFIGYEVLGYEYSGFHTMYCHRNLINHCKIELHIHFNDNGLIDKFEDAEKIIDSIRSEKIGAEPALWQPWAVYEFDTV